MNNKFLTEYVFDYDRLTDENGKPNVVYDFKLEVATRGELALCSSKGNHKVDKLIYLLSYLMDIPQEVFSYTVELAKDYYNVSDVERLATYVSTRTPVYYLYYNKVLEDINIMNVPVDTKKSIFCRYIEDICEVDINIAKNLLLEVLDSSISYLKDIASIYLREINLVINEELQENNENEEDNDKKFYSSLKLLSDFQINKYPTLTKEKNRGIAHLLNKFVKKVNNEDETSIDNATNSFVDFLKNKGVNVVVTERTLDDNDDLLEQLERINDRINEISDTIDETINDSVQADNLKKEVHNSKKKFRVIKRNRFSGVICDWSEYFDTIEEAQELKNNWLKNFSQLVEKFEFEIESKEDE